MEYEAAMSKDLGVQVDTNDLMQPVSIHSQTPAPPTTRSIGKSGHA